MMSIMEKTQKIDSECRTFKDQWNFKYFVVQFGYKVLCLIFNKTITVIKELNIKWHYETNYFQNILKVCGQKNLKRELQSQYFFKKVNTEQEAATHASIRVVLEIAKREKPFTNKEMIKECEL
ncbi:general transcription factor II-I repeat domain-containing protein 2 [Trichonephila clavata]|uniref:General transcription factor II-I repeat domain-containing protein 2 n=1 Tax=Trichonephila clavata TaxID=2740835 RepID=A0A8X6FAU1_TRICU|nr:general transcription factor II-I repeat domain-containing protein 2 [Trichonephila clavata]